MGDFYLQKIEALEGRVLVLEDQLEQTLDLLHEHIRVFEEMIDLFKGFGGLL